MGLKLVFSHSRQCICQISQMILKASAKTQGIIESICCQRHDPIRPVIKILLVVDWTAEIALELFLSVLESQIVFLTFQGVFYKECLHILP